MKGWLKTGCLGCLGCLGVVLALIALVVGLAWFRARSQTMADHVMTHPVPTAHGAGGGGESGGRTVPVAKPAGKVILDLHEAAFRIDPAAAGEPIRVEASYDDRSHVLEESFEQDQSGAWTYRVSFRRTRSSTWLTAALEHAFSGRRPTVRILLPLDSPMALETKIERGQLTAELGGLRVTTGVFQVSLGGLELRVSKPIPDPMERLEIHTEMGGGEIHSLGNASPRVLDVDLRMGGMDLDLRGNWRADADISIRGRMGGSHVRLPTGVRIVGVEGGKLEAPNKGELPVPTLKFSTSVEMGDVKFED